MNDDLVKLRKMAARVASQNGLLQKLTMVMETVAKLLDMYAEGEVPVSRVELKQMADMLRGGTK